MLLGGGGGGGERARTPRGDNNAYCHANEISWDDCRPDAAKGERWSDPDNHFDAGSTLVVAPHTVLVAATAR